MNKYWYKNHYMMSKQIRFDIPNTENCFCDACSAKLVTDFLKLNKSVLYINAKSQNVRKSVDIITVSTLMLYSMADVYKGLIQTKCIELKRFTSTEEKEW